MLDCRKSIPSSLKTINRSEDASGPLCFGIKQPLRTLYAHKDGSGATPQPLDKARLNRHGLTAKLLLFFCCTSGNVTFSVFKPAQNSNIVSASENLQTNKLLTAWIWAHSWGILFSPKNSIMGFTGSFWSVETDCFFFFLKRCHTNLIGSLPEVLSPLIF